MKYEDLIYTLYCDFYRQTGKEISKKNVIRYLFSIYREPGFKYVFILRLCQYLNSKKRNLLDKIIFRVLRYKFRKMQYKYGIDIPYITEIKEGFLISHFTGIFINSHVKIGRNCSILQGVTIGNNLYKGRKKVAKIGDNVFIGTGAKIIGSVTIGNNVTIGANAVITKDIPDNSVVAGIPAKIISNKQSIDINRNYKTRNEFFKKLNLNSSMEQAIKS